MPRAPLGKAAVAAVLFALPGLLYSQAIEIAPKAVKLLQVEGGPLAVAKVSIRSAGPNVQPWTVTATPGDPNDPWIQLSAPGGTTPALLTVGIVNWRGESKKPGKYPASISIKSGGAVVTLPVVLEVRAAHPPPAFSYLSGPAGCNQAAGYPDPPLCTPLTLPGILGPPQAGASYVDPNFGGRVRVMTAASIYHTYSTPSPLSAHRKYLMGYLDDGTWQIVDVATTRVLFRRNPCNQSYFWDATDDEVYYYFQGAAILKHDLRTNKSSVLIDYSKTTEQFHEIVHGGTGDTSKDNWISFWAPDDKTICALDLNLMKTYCADYADSQRNLAYGDVDFTLISKGTDRTSGKRYVMLIAPPAMGIFSVDLANGTLKLEFRGPESPEKPGNNDGVCDPGERCYVGSHLDTLEDSAGIQYLVENGETSTPCEVSLSTYQLNTGINLLKQVELGGGRKKVMTLWRCGRGWVDEHIGCAKAAPYCVISTQSEARRPDDLSEYVPTPHAGEIIVMRENGLEIRRLALSRTVFFTGAGDGNYWAAPRAAISNDGSVVTADSNFGQRGKPRVTLIETGFGPRPN
jgi:hypothetical protein